MKTLKDKQEVQHVKWKKPGSKDMKKQRPESTGVAASTDKGFCSVSGRMVDIAYQRLCASFKSVLPSNYF